MIGQSLVRQLASAVDMHFGGIPRKGGLQAAPARCNTSQGTKIFGPNFVADARPTRGSLFRIYRDTRFSPDKRPFKTHVGIHFSHASGKDAHAPVFYLHLEPDNCFAAAGVWHPDSRALTKIRTAIIAAPEQWAKARGKLELEGDSLVRPPRGFDPNHRFIADIKRKDFVASVRLAEAQVCGPRFMRDFATACRTMLPLVEFTTRALGLEP